MSVVAAVAAVVGAVATVASNRQSAKAAKATRKAEERARRVENAVSRLENQKAIRRRIQEQRQEEARLTQQAETAGVSGSSALLGSVGAGLTTAASDIGFARARFAGFQGASDIRSAGARRAGGFQQRAATFGTVATVSSLFSNAQSNQALQQGFQSFTR
jgi:hypothetical protein